MSTFDIVLLRESTSEPWGLQLEYQLFRSNPQQWGCFCVAAVKPGSPSGRCAALRVDDTIIGVNGETVVAAVRDDFAEFLATLNASGRAVHLTIERGRKPGKPTPERKAGEVAFDGEDEGVRVVVRRDDVHQATSVELCVTELASFADFGGPPPPPVSEVAVEATSEPAAAEQQPDDEPATAAEPAAAAEEQPDDEPATAAESTDAAAEMTAAEDEPGDYCSSARSAEEETEAAVGSIVDSIVDAAVDEETPADETTEAAVGSIVDSLVDAAVDEEEETGEAAVGSIVDSIVDAAVTDCKESSETLVEAAVGSIVDSIVDAAVTDCEEPPAAETLGAVGSIVDSIVDAAVTDGVVEEAPGPSDADIKVAEEEAASTSAPAEEEEKEQASRAEQAPAYRMKFVPLDDDLCRGARFAGTIPRLDGSDRDDAGYSHLRLGDALVSIDDVCVGIPILAVNPASCRSVVNLPYGDLLSALRRHPPLTLLFSNIADIAPPPPVEVAAAPPTASRSSFTEFLKKGLF